MTVSLTHFSRPCKPRKYRQFSDDQVKALASRMFGQVEPGQTREKLIALIEEAEKIATEYERGVQARLEARRRG